jgi:hypothetical protein
MPPLTDAQRSALSAVQTRSESCQAASQRRRVYRSQWVTGISNGGLTAFPGGERDRWEERLFAGAYQRSGVTADEHPIYGGLDLLGHPDGSCPRFGSCDLVASLAAEWPTPNLLGRAIDDYIEAQIHGRLRLEDDVDAVVADPSFRGSETGRSLVEAFTASPAVTSAPAPAST